MNNELLFLILMLVDLAFVLLCFRLGKHYLYVAVIANILFTNMVSSKLVDILGFDQTVANVFYAAIFLATDLLSEHHGRKYATRAVMMGLVGLVPIIAFAPFVTAFAPTSFSTEVSDALEVIFAWTPRIAIASLIAYVVAQNLDVLLYERLKSIRPGDNWLWFRNNGSTMVSQFVDQLIFVSLAFAGVVPFSVLIQIFIAGYVIKVIVAAVDTPFMYLASVIKPRNAEGLPE